MLHLLQICNVGTIVGGTAACAWTIRQSLPWARHTVAFLSPISEETQAAFCGARLLRWEKVTREASRALQPDLVILHNTAAHRAETSLPAPTLQYAHSRIAHAPADRMVYCSRWLASHCGQPAGTVLYQAVPCPKPPDLRTDPAVRALRSSIVVGRICTPDPRKWPDALVDLYRLLAGTFPEIDWEFVGCPRNQRPAIQNACEGRATFHHASWQARSRLHHWDALLYHHPQLTESFGRTCAEAMRAGCIPIVDDRGGFREQLAGTPLAEAGCLCGNPDDFLKALASLNNRTTRWKLSRTARAIGDERFSLAGFANRLRPLFHDLASRRENLRPISRDASE